jgi:hypothetical protein
MPLARRAIVTIGLPGAKASSDLCLLLELCRETAVRRTNLIDRNAVKMRTFDGVNVSHGVGLQRSPRGRRLLSSQHDNGCILEAPISVHSGHG